jgi:drug/metabolite transporter (DMT)-like permease
MVLSGFTRFRSQLVLGVLCVAWFCCSALIILWTKYLLSGGAIVPATRDQRPLFPFPLLITLSNNTGCALIGAGLVLGSWLRSNLRHGEPVPWSPPVRWPTGPRWWRFLVAIGACTALEIGCANWSLQKLTVAFSTLLKCNAPVFVLFWSILLGIELFSWVTLGSLFLMCMGAALMTTGDSLQFSIVGATVLLAGIALGGFRWALSQVILQRTVRDSSADPATKTAQQTRVDKRLTPLEAVVLLAPVTAFFLAPAVYLLELRPLWESLRGPSRETSEILAIFGSLAGIAGLVFVLLWLEYAIVQRTSSLAISVVSIMKELLTILAGMVTFGDHVGWRSFLGLALSQGGFLAFLRHRQGWLQRTPDTDAPSENSSVSQLVPTQPRDHLAPSEVIEASDEPHAVLLDVSMP